MKFGKQICAVLAAIIMLTATACSVDLSSTAEESRTVMTVDGFEVPFEMYRYAAQMHLRDKLAAYSAAETDVVTNESGEPDASALPEDDRLKIAEEVQKNSLDMIGNVYSLFTAAKEEGIDPFGEMINSLTDMKMEEIRATYENDREYLETIKQFHMTDSVYSVLTRYEIVSTQLYELYVKNGRINTSDDAVIEYMNGDGCVRVTQILISFERHSEEEAYALAKEVADEVKTFTAEDGTVDADKFDELTDKRGEDLFMFKNRDGYYLCRGYADKAFETAAFGLEIGKASEPVRVTAGYSVMLRAPKDADYIRENIDTLSEACLSGIYQSILDEYSANAEIVTNEEFGKIDLYSMK